MLLLTALVAAETEPCGFCGVWTSTSASVTLVVLPNGQAQLYDLVSGESPPAMKRSRDLSWAAKGATFQLGGETYAVEGKALVNQGGPGGWEKTGGLPGEREIATWAHAWSSQDHGAYSAFYGDSFQAKGMDQTAWLADKKTKFEKASCIDVSVEDIESDGLTTTFKQTYVSSSWCDEGQKTLTWTLGVDGWVLVGEEQPTAETCDARCSY